MIKIKRAFFAEHVQIDKSGNSVQVAVPDSDPKLKDVEILFDYDKGILHFIDPVRDQVLFLNTFRTLTVDIASYISHFRNPERELVMVQTLPKNTIEIPGPEVVKKRRGRKPNPISEDVNG